MSKKFLNVKIGVSFYNKLTENPVFKDNWKAISAAYWFLKTVMYFQSYKQKPYVNIYHRTIYNIFKPYLKDGGYKQYLDALQDLGLILINEKYLASASKNGFCKSYKATPLAFGFVNSNESEYLKNLQFSKEERRKIQKRRSANKVKAETQDPVLDYINDFIINLKYDKNKADSIIKNNHWKEETLFNANYSLELFESGFFEGLKYNKTDGRVYNPYVGMNSQLRPCFTYKGMRLVATIDIRACHPTFLSTYLIKTYKDNTKEHNLYTIPITTIPTSVPKLYHYVSSKPDICHFSEKLISSTNEEDRCFESLLLPEHEKWINLFCSPASDPRDIIASKIGKTKAQVKNELTQFINGNLKVSKIKDWMAEEFPCLFEVWKRTKIKTTGTNLSLGYETKVFLNNELFSFATSLSTKVGYEYDGCSVFSSGSTEEIINQVNLLTKKIKQIAKKETGLDIILKTTLIPQSDHTLQT